MVRIANRKWLHVQIELEEPNAAEHSVRKDTNDMIEPVSLATCIIN